MPTHSINLNTLISWYGLPDKNIRSKVREAARVFINKPSGGGGNFHVPFWRDIKLHIEGLDDLRQLTNERIGDNERLRRLYLMLTDSFLVWWTKKRRWTNQGVSIINAYVKGEFCPSNYDARIKVKNFLSMQIGDDPVKSFYPYFSENPPLTDESARVALWAIYQAIPSANTNELRILDVLRSKSYSLKKNPLHGNEEELFMRHYEVVNRYWEHFCSEFSRGSAA